MAFLERFRQSDPKASESLLPTGKQWPQVPEPDRNLQYLDQRGLLWRFEHINGEAGWRVGTAGAYYTWGGACLIHPKSQPLIADPLSV